MATRSVSPEARFTIGEYEELPPDDYYTIELSGGVLVREPAPGAEHGRIQTCLAHLLYQHTQAGDHGMVTSNSGFVLFDEPPTVRVPDVAFVPRERLGVQPVDAGFWRGAPDLAIEINSPSNSASDNLRKMNEYLDAGVRLVWVIDPPSRTVTVYRSRDSIQLLGIEAELDGRPVLPDLRIAVGNVFG